MILPNPEYVALDAMAKLRELGVKNHPVSCSPRVATTQGPTRPKRDSGVEPSSIIQRYPEIRVWYIEAGRGMGETLQLANEKQAYTLSDIGTYLAYKGDLDLVR